MRVIWAALSLGALALAGGCASAPRETNAAGEYLAGRLAARINAVDDAAAAYAEAHRVAPGQIDILKEAFFYHIAAGDIDAAVPYAEKLVAADAADDGMPRLLLAATATKAGDLTTARALLSGRLDEPFVKSVAYLSDVWVEKARAGANAAIETLDEPPADVFTGFNPLHRALLAESAGRDAEARAAYQAAVATLGGPVARVAYGAFLERQGEADAARAFYEELAKEDGPSRRIAEGALARLGRGKATSAYAKVSAAEGAAIAYYSFAGAMVQQAAGERQRAEDAGFNVGEPRFNLPLSLARVALYLDPDFEEARRLVALILSIYGDHAAAYDVLAEISPSSAYYEQARIEMAGGLVVRGKPDEAIRLLKDSMRRDRSAHELRWTLASVYAAEDRDEEAARTLDAILAEPDADEIRNVWRYYVSRGAALLELDRWEAAEADLKKAVELAPDEPIALNYLGYSWAERGVNLDEAFALIEKAVALEPRSGAIIDSLGWAHYQLGDYEEAVGHLEQAAALEPDDPTITDHLGDVYWRLGRKIEAGYQWRRALELDPPDKLRRALDGKIEKGLPEASDEA